MDAFQQALAGWFDSAMERVSAAYKRRAMLISLLLSLLLAVLFNIDSIHLFQSLWQQPGSNRNPYPSRGVSRWLSRASHGTELVHVAAQFANK